MTTKTKAMSALFCGALLCTGLLLAHAYAVVIYLLSLGMGGEVTQEMVQFILGALFSAAALALVNGAYWRVRDEVAGWKMRAQWSLGCLILSGLFAASLAEFYQRVL